MKQKTDVLMFLVKIENIKLINDSKKERNQHDLLIINEYRLSHTIIIFGNKYWITSYYTQEIMIIRIIVQL